MKKFFVFITILAMSLNMVSPAFAFETSPIADTLLQENSDDIVYALDDDTFFIDIGNSDTAISILPDDYVFEEYFYFDDDGYIHRYSDLSVSRSAVLTMTAVSYIGMALLAATLGVAITADADAFAQIVWDGYLSLKEDAQATVAAIGTLFSSGSGGSLADVENIEETYAEMQTYLATEVLGDSSFTYDSYLDSTYSVATTGYSLESFSNTSGLSSLIESDLYMLASTAGWSLVYIYGTTGYFHKFVEDEYGYYYQLVSCPLADLGITSLLSITPYSLFNLTSYDVYSSTKIYTSSQSAYNWWLFGGTATTTYFLTDDSYSDGYSYVSSNSNSYNYFQYRIYGLNRWVSGGLSQTDSYVTLSKNMFGESGQVWSNVETVAQYPVSYDPTYDLSASLMSGTLTIQPGTAVLDEDDLMDLAPAIDFAFVETLVNTGYITDTDTNTDAGVTDSTETLGWLSSIYSTLTNIWTAVSSIASTVVSGVSSVVTSATTSVTTAISTAVSTVNSFFEGVIDSATATITSAIALVYDVIVSLPTAIIEGIGTFLTAMSDTITLIYEFIVSLPTAIIEGIGTFLTAISDTITLIYEFIVSIPTAIATVVTDIFTALETAFATAIVEPYEYVIGKFAVFEVIYGYCIGVFDEIFIDDPEPPVIWVDFSNSNSDAIQYYGMVKVLDLSWYAEYKPYGDMIIAGILWVFFLWRLFSRIPDIIRGVGMQMHGQAKFESRRSNSDN